MLKNIESGITVIHLHGINGSGKDTQADKAAKENPAIRKISTGDIVRAVADPSRGIENRYHDLLSPYIIESQNGGLIPDEVISKVAEGEFDRWTKEAYKLLLYTGYPRTINQLLLMDEVIKVKSKGQKVQTAHVLIDFPEEAVYQRAEKRRAEDMKNFGNTRKDDAPETVAKRIKVFNETTVPMLDYLRDSGRLIVVNGDNTISGVKTELETMVADNFPRNGVIFDSQSRGMPNRNSSSVSLLY